MKIALFGNGNKKIKKSPLVRRKFLVIVCLLLLLTTVVVSSLTWLFFDLGEKSISRTNELHFAALSEQLIQLQIADKTQRTLAQNSSPLGTTVITE